MKVIITSKLNLFLILIATSVLFLGFTSESFAGTLQPDNYPYLPDAFVNYDSVNDESTITWNFSALPDYTDGSLDGKVAKCAVKSDYDFNNNPETNPDLEITSFNPLNYNPTYLPTITGVVLTSIIDSNVKGVEIPCEGQFTIDWSSVMGNAANTGSYVGVEPFISFYVLTSDEEFDTSDGIVLDEILIMYHPTATTISQDTVDWACGANDFTDEKPKDGIDDNQIAVGNVLFIDQSGIRGTGGPNNCNTVLELESEEYCCTFPSTTVATTEGGGGGSSNDHKSRPTFGVDYNMFSQAVDAGLKINDKSFLVIDNYWTEIPMQNLTVGDVQNFTATTYAPKTLKVMEFLFGVPEVGEWDKAESSVAIFLDYRGDVMDIIPKNADDIIINYNTMNYSSSLSKCKIDSNTPTCNTVSIEVIFNEAPVGKVMALQAIDYKGRTNILYFNDGLDLDGDSQNPPVTMEITSPVKYKGVQTIQRVDKVNDTWMTLDDDEPVLLYQRNSFGTFNPIEWRTVMGTPDEISEIMSRYHSEFSRYVESEHLKAVDVFDSSLIQGTITPSFAYEFPENTDRQTHLSKLIDYEIKRANIVFSEKYTID